MSKRQAGARVLFLAPYPVADAATRHRILQFFPALREAGLEPTFHSFFPPRLYAIKNEPGPRLAALKASLLLAACGRRLAELLSVGRYDMLFVHREVFPFFTPAVERLARRLQPRFVYDFDDAIYTRPTYQRNWRDWLRDPARVADVVSLASHVIVGSRHLEEYARQHTTAVTRIPTPVDTDRYQPRTSRSPSGDAPVIGWVGSHSTLPSLQLILPALEILRSRGHDFRLKVVGARNVHDLDAGRVPVERVVWTLDQEVANLQGCDIGVMPLASSPWEDAKCGFKLIQYMAVGLPCVASPVGENRYIVEHGRSGLLAESADEWVAALGSLLRDEELRRQMGEVGRQRAEEQYSLRALSGDLVRTLRAVLG
ncbi:MAG: glycosyltransferase family 4 protein [Chloroflexi bacterium]|nr:glycosyltransferase family 4 protein [Chloroflexota bacterium]